MNESPMGTPRVGMPESNDRSREEESLDRWPTSRMLARERQNFRETEILARPLEN